MTPKKYKRTFLAQCATWVAISLLATTILPDTLPPSERAFVFPWLFGGTQLLALAASVFVGRFVDELLWTREQRPGVAPVWKAAFGAAYLIVAVLMAIGGIPAADRILEALNLPSDGLLASGFGYMFLLCGVIGFAAPAIMNLRDLHFLLSPYDGERYWKAKAEQLWQEGEYVAFLQMLDEAPPDKAARLINRLCGTDKELLDAVLRWLEYSPRDRALDPQLRHDYFKLVRKTLTVEAEEPGPATVNPFTMALKRASDIVLSLAIMVIVVIYLLPTLILTFALLRLELRGQGSMLFVATRVGRGGKEFQHYQFRTLPSKVMRGTPRLTPLRAFIMQMGFDRLPLLYNVLKGDMSIVGPHPLYAAHIQQLKIMGANCDDLKVRLSITPGVIGPAQLDALQHPGRRSCLDYLAIDVKYASHWPSLLTDLLILPRFIHVYFFISLRRAIGFLFRPMRRRARERRKEVVA